MSTLVPIDSERIAVMARGGTQLRAIADVVGDYGDARDYGSSVEEGAERIQPMASGNTRITKYPEANYQSGAVTNNAGSEYKTVSGA